MRAPADEIRRRSKCRAGRAVALAAVMSRALLVAAVTLPCTIGAAHIAAQKTVAVPGEMETATATIKEIDARHRFVVLGDEGGSDLGVFAPPEFTRFDELRVGDRITITFYESTVYQLTRRHAPAPAVSEEVGAVESQSPLPGATFSYQTTERVTVRAVDRKAALITVVGRDGRTISRRVHNSADLEGVKTGDHIDITYTQALLASVTRAK
jgi:Cu/Ag efflux protein CusF